MDRGLQLLAQFGQGGIGRLRHQHQQPGTAVGIHLRRGSPGMRPGGERAGFPAALEQAANPGGTDPEPAGNVDAAAKALIAGADDTFTEIL
jgi:hypothetical protein